ncbi:hypothetical protein V12B01_13255 [Vibrio splendidus 12B01]|nr:hypothetical protein V12B01_13255 [Vibrio splendidus 12B01]
MLNALSQKRSLPESKLHDTFMINYVGL